VCGQEQGPALGEFGRKAAAANVQAAGIVVIGAAAITAVLVFLLGVRLPAQRPLTAVAE